MMIADMACCICVSCECKEGSYEAISCNDDGAVSVTALTNFSQDDDDDNDDDGDDPAVLTLSEPRFDVDNHYTDVSFRSSQPFDHHDHNSVTINPNADSADPPILKLPSIINNDSAMKKKRDINEVRSHSDPSTARHRLDMVMTMNTTITSIDLTRSALIAAAAIYAADDVTDTATCHSAAATAIRDRESSLNCECPIEGCNDDDDSMTNSEPSSRRAIIKQKRSSDAAGTGDHTSSSSSSYRSTRSRSSSARSSSNSSYRTTSISYCRSDLDCDDEDDDVPQRRRRRRSVNRSHHMFSIHAHNKQASRWSNKLRQRTCRDEDKLRCYDSNDEHSTSLSRKRTRDVCRHITDGGPSATTADRGGGGGPRPFSDLILSWWERDEDCKDAKMCHVDKIDSFCSEDRERLILLTTLWRQDTVLEPNMFPYQTPPGVAHYTLWSIHDLTKQEIIAFVDAWLLRHVPTVRRWQYDDNSGERSVDLFHVHVFVEMVPYSFSPPPEEIYTPPHALHVL